MGGKLNINAPIFKPTYVKKPHKEEKKLSLLAPPFFPSIRTTSSNNIPLIHPHFQYISPIPYQPRPVPY